MEDFWIGSILCHCRCLWGMKTKNDGECSPSLQMLMGKETQWMGSALHHPGHISPKSCSPDGEHSLLPLSMSTKKVALQMGSAPYVACPITRFQQLTSFSPYL
jgi:hypothetical protein